MRSVPSGFTNVAHSQARIISAYAKVTDNRLRFTNLNKIANDSALYDGAMKSHDSDWSGSSIYRVANVNNTLYYMYLSNPGGSWPNWQSSGISLKADSRPGIYMNCVWYQKSTGDIKRAYINGSSFGSEIDVSVTISDPTALAPISIDEAMMRVAPTTKHYAKVAYVKDNSVGIGTVYYWSGRIYKLSLLEGEIKDEVFDAEKDPTTGWIHVFWSDDQVGKVKHIKLMGGGGRHGPLEQVIPMDVVDDLNNFHLGGVSVANRSTSYSFVEPPSYAGALWVGGGLVRTDGGHMQVYMQGPPWTFGRDVYVGTDGTQARTYSGKTVPVAGGKMHFVGSKVYYIGPGIAYEANGTDWTGDSSPTLTINDIHSWNIQQQPNDSAKLQMEIPMSTSGTALREGSDIEVYAQYSTEGGATYDALMGTFNIDVFLKGQDQAGKYKTIIARSKAGKALEMWSPDTSYDYWGADHKVNLPATLTELVRTDGTMIESGGYIIAEGLNDFTFNYNYQDWHQGHMYSLARPSRGGICKMRFRYTSSTLYDPQAGITLNLYRETEEEALARIDPYEYRGYGGKIPWNWYGMSTLAVVWGTRENSGSPGISVRWISMSDWDCVSEGQILGTHALSLSANTDYWLMTRFNEGKLEIFYRADASTSWTSVATYTLEEGPNGILPWMRAEQTGRFGLYLYNETPWVTAPAIQSDSTKLPFRSKTDQHGRTFTFPNTYQVDHELFYVTALEGTAAVTKSSSFENGHIWSGVSQPWTNSAAAPFTGYPSTGLWDIWNGQSYTSKHYFDNMVMVIQNTGKQYIVTDWDYYAPSQWSPTPMDANWISHVGNGSYGSWSASQWVRWFVDDTPYNVKPGDTYEVLWAGACTRGYGDSQATSHSSSQINLYTAERIKCDRFEVYTDEREWSMADMMTEVARKAGVIDIEPKYHLAPTQSKSHSQASWSLASQLGSDGVRQANVVARALKTSGSGEFGIQFGRVNGSSGYVVAVDNGGYVNLYDADTTTLIERIYAGANIAGWVTFSAQKNRVNVYENETLIAAFKLANEIDTLAYSAPAYKNVTVKYDWPELSMRVDNFIMDMGKKGVAILQQLIGQKRLFWQDDQYGKLRLYRDRVTVNSGDPWLMAHEGATVFNEADLATRVRVEGAEAWQSIDETAIQDHGSIFRLFNAEDAENAQDAAVEAEWLLDDTAKRADRITLSGAADARVEAGDIIQVTIPDPDGGGSITKSVVVDQIGFDMQQSETMVQFDMTIQGHNAE